MLHMLSFFRVNVPRYKTERFGSQTTMVSLLWRRRLRTIDGAALFAARRTKQLSDPELAGPLGRARSVVHARLA